MKANPGAGLVVSGSNVVAEQLMVNAINNVLGNYGTTINMSVTSHQAQGSDADFAALVTEMKAGSVDLIIVMNANPAYDAPMAKDFAGALAKVKNKVSFNGTVDETTELCDIIAPGHHFLESWGDVEAKEGMFSLIQPTIAPLFDTRQAELSLLIWAESANVDKINPQPYYEYVKNNWKNTVFPVQNKVSSFTGFWDSCVHDGVFNLDKSSGSNSFTAVTISGDITKPSGKELEISF